MDGALIGDAILNLFGAIGLSVALLIFQARDPHGPLTRRFTIVLGLIALLFLLRGAFWLTGTVLLGRLAVACAAMMPLGFLVVTEGVLRRHAPKLLKVVALAGSVGLAILALVLPVDAIDGALVLFQLAMLAACGVLMMTPPAEGLALVEARVVRRLCVAVFVLLPFVVTDFRDLWPDVPIRAGALGALVVVTFALVADAASEPRRQHAMLVALRIGTGLVLGLALAALVRASTTAETIRIVAVTLGGVLALTLVLEASRAYLMAGTPGLLDTVANARGAGREELVADLLRSPLFEGAVRLDEAALADFDPDLLRATLAEKLLLRRADHPFGLRPTDPVAERLDTLLAAHDASHLVVVGTEPLDLLAVRVPLILADRATETGLLLAGRLLASGRAA